MVEASARPDPERLPWLDTPRAAATAPSAASPRRVSRGPIYVLLALFLAASVGVISFLAGRGTAPLAPVAGRSATTQLPAPAPTPAPAPSTTAELPIAVVPAPEVRSSDAPAKVLTTPRPAARRASQARPAARRPVRRASVNRARPRPAVVVHRRINWPPPPSAGKPGRVIQLGAYATARQADASWRRLVAVYPYLGELPKVVTPNRPLRGQPLFYRLRLGAHSAREARALCRNLHRIGRGCMVV